MKSYLLLIVLKMLNMLSAGAEPHTLATIRDPAGDDHGAGTLIYPQRSDFHVGDLDLLKLKIGRDIEGFWFEATFKNSIRNPEGVINGVGAESLANFAARVFTSSISTSTSTLIASRDQVTLLLCQGARFE